MESGVLVLKRFSDMSEETFQITHDGTKHCGGDGGLMENFAMMLNANNPIQDKWVLKAHKAVFAAEESAETSEKIDYEETLGGGFSISTDEFVMDFDDEIYIDNDNEALQAQYDEAVLQAKTALLSGETLDAVTICVDRAASALLELTGEKTTEAVVDDVFSRFCVGK